MGGIFTGGIVALVGDWSTPSDAFAGLIITPIMAGFGASIGALIGSLSDSVITKKYIIDDDNWKIVAGLQQSSNYHCLLYTSPSPRDQRGSRMPSSA